MNYMESLGMILSLVTSSELHRDYERLSMKVDLLISMSAMILLVCPYSSHIRKAPDICLQRKASVISTQAGRGLVSSISIIGAG